MSNRDSPPTRLRGWLGRDHLRRVGHEFPVDAAAHRRARPRQRRLEDGRGSAGDRRARRGRGQGEARGAVARTRAGLGRDYCPHDRSRP
jgi:hypothetical protein